MFIQEISKSSQTYKCMSVDIFSITDTTGKETGNLVLSLEQKGMNTSVLSPALGK